MNNIMNLNLNIDKELELERQGHRRTRRWVGDAAQTSWYQSRIIPFSGSGQNMARVNQIQDTQSRLDAYNETLTRFLRPSNHQPFSMGSLG